MTAIGIMNRDSGVTEERLEVFSSNEKRAIVDLIDPKKDPWEPTLKTRGFEDIVDDFLVSKRTDYDEILKTHRICEHIVRLATQPPSHLAT
jgi:virulence factor